MASYQDLFNPKTIERLCDNIKVTSKQKQSTKEWLEMLDSGRLKKEKGHYIDFAVTVLRDLLGYPIKSREGMAHEEGNVEFVISNNEDKQILCIEAKGTETKDLFAPQHRAKKEHETPIKQTWDYMGSIGLDYGICTNYKEFVLITKEHGYSKCHVFNFESIGKNPDKLKEFIGIFSKERIIEKGFVEKLHKESVVEEREFTKEFYKLYHETRLMMVKAFEEKEDVQRTEAVYYTQIFLNRLIFIFFVEDKGFIPDKHLFSDRILHLLETGNFDEHSRQIFNNVKELFISFDKGSRVSGIFGFNGSLFSGVVPEKVYFSDLREEKFFEDVKQYSKLSKSTKLNEKASRIIKKHTDLNPIISNLLIMDSFDFNTEVNVNILGHIFEQSISDLEELKQEGISRRKKEGVYYTPEYITDYICRNTIIPYLSKSGKSTISELVKEYEGSLDELETKFKEIEILDPACGSGAFLVKAVDILLELHKEMQSKKGDKNRSNGQLQMTQEWDENKETRAIIENNIYGVDINSESVDITKLSLFLRLASTERKLKDLSKNIRVGNSLIDDSSVDNSAFVWEEKFPHIFLHPDLKKHLDQKHKDGFDIVVGNPPYVQLSSDKVTEKVKKFLISKYGSSMGRLNTFGFFIKLGMDLMKEDGRLGFIVPNTLLTQDYYAELRSSILNACEIESITNFSKLPFKDAVVENTIPILKKSKNEIKRNTNKITILEAGSKMNFIKQKEIPQIDFVKNKNSAFGIFADEESSKIKKKIEKNTKPLATYLQVNQAIALKHSREKWITFDGTKKNAKPLLVGGKNINRYSMNWDGSYLIYDVNGIHSCKTETIFLTKEKLIFRRVANKLIATLDDKQFYGLHTLVVMNLKENTKQDLRYFLGLFNSKLMNYYYNKVFASTKTIFSEIGARQVELLPIKLTTIHDEKTVIDKVNNLLELNQSIVDIRIKFFNRLEEDLKLKKLSKFEGIEKMDFNKFQQKLKKQGIVMTNNQKNKWEDQFLEKKKIILENIQNTYKSDDELNNLIYKIYDLSDYEINIIENSLN